MKFTILTFLIIIMVSQEGNGTRCSAINGKCKRKCLSTEIGLNGHGCCHHKKCCYEPSICMPSCRGICQTNGCGCTQCDCDCHDNCMATNSTCCSDFLTECYGMIL